MFEFSFFSTPPYQLQNLSLNWTPNFSFSGVLEQKEERNGQEQKIPPCTHTHITKIFRDIWGIFFYYFFLDYVYTTVRGFTVVYQETYVKTAKLQILGLIKCLVKRIYTDCVHRYWYTIVRGFTVVHQKTYVRNGRDLKNFCVLMWC